MFFSCDNFTKTSEITLKSSEITVRGRKSQLCVEEKLNSDDDDDHDDDDDDDDDGDGDDIL